MNVTFEIIVNKPKDGVHRAGQEVTGVITCTVRKNTTFKLINLYLLGTSKCAFTCARNKTNQDFLEETIIFLTKPLDSQAFTCAGVHSLQFSFNLPDKIPSSYKTTNPIIANIKYVLKVEHKEANLFSATQAVETEIIVYSYINPVILSPSKRKLYHKTLNKPIVRERQDIILRTDMTKDFAMPGEVISIHFKLINLTDLPIATIKTEFVKRTALMQPKKTKKKNFYAVVTMDVYPKTYDDCTVETKSFPAKSTSAASVDIHVPPDVYTILYSDIVSVTYAIRVTIKLPEPYEMVSPVIQIPIEVGDMIGRENMGVIEFDDVEELLGRDLKAKATVSESVNKINFSDVKKLSRALSE